ncbi:MAG: PrsW family intramembrane metalloprotease [Treponema sp.]|jgi:RsiW-degrading membrane proteinase PrsW (M82 family)|nr:PrsW family intramembrane metalloprotease [Treponema sp.]
MDGLWVLLLLILIAALPAVIVFFWFRAIKSSVTKLWFLASLAAGIISLLVATLIQKLFPASGGNGLWPFFFSVFIRIALVEEMSRLVSLIPLLKISNRYQNSREAFYTALGFVSGLGFAMIENAFYGISDINITLLRAFTASLVHAACGIRVGAAFFSINNHPAKAIFLFISAVIIHGAYNLMILSPALPSVLAIPIAFAALFTSIHLIKTKARDDEKYPIQPSP